MSEYERPDRYAREPTLEDVRQLMGASTPHFALQLRNRIRTLIERLPAGHPARVEGEREIARLDVLAFGSERRGPDPAPRGGAPEPAGPHRAAGLNEPSPPAAARARVVCERQAAQGGAMAWEFHVLVVANVTATSDELLTALRERAGRGACRFTLLMPRDGADTDARLAEALEGMRAAGLDERQRPQGQLRPDRRDDGGLGPDAVRRDRGLDPADRLVALARARPAAPAREADLRARASRRLPAAASPRSTGSAPPRASSTGCCRRSRRRCSARTTPS